MSEIPEGDFFCDRCLAVRWFSTECEVWFYHFAKNAVKCALCPLHHGGLKPTTDGRWVHLCCSFWAGSAVIKNLDEMSPIDISSVEICIPTSEPPLEPSFFEVAPPVKKIQCFCCGGETGLLKQCSGFGEDGTPCSVRFHPLCAWFKGLYLATAVTDPTFQARDSGGKYPSGLSFSFYCGDHCPSAHSDPVTREDQVCAP